jgi:hypothetical protein
MVRSLAVVLAIVGVIVGINLAGRPTPDTQAVNYRDAVVAARQTASYDVLAPVSLPPGWRATSARTDTEGGVVEWHLGLVTASEEYAAVEQSDRRPARVFVDRFAEGARPAGEEDVSGVAWRRVEGGDPEPRALVRTDDGVTVVVAGSASWAELADLAASLRGAAA